jgi:hypothetical protein
VEQQEFSVIVKETGLTEKLETLDRFGQQQQHLCNPKA